MKKWILDGWITEGEQIASPPGLIKAFCRCYQCRRVWPHWWSNIAREDFRLGKYRKLGCPCGSLKLSPAILPAWQSVYWFVVRGWLIRKLILRCRVWDPRMPIMEKDLQ